MASLHYRCLTTCRSNLLVTLVIENPTCTVFHIHGRLDMCHLLTTFHIHGRLDMCHLLTPFHIHGRLDMCHLLTPFHIHGRLDMCHLLTPFLSVFEFRIAFTLSNEVSIRLCVNYGANTIGPAFRFWYQR